MDKDRIIGIAIGSAIAMALVGGFFLLQHLYIKGAM